MNTSTLANVSFQWTRYLSDGTSNTVILSEDVDNSNVAGSASGIMHQSTYNITNVNYTNNGDGLQCNVSGDTSAIAYLTGS